MKIATLRTYLDVHSWAGLLAGFALFIAFYAGALTVFHDDIALWQNPPWRGASQAPLPPAEFVDQLLQQHPQARDDFGLVLAPSASSQASYAFWFTGGKLHYADAAHVMASSDTAPSGNLADFIYALHYSLGLPQIGLYFMGIISLIYGVALVSGVIIHLPQLVADLFALRAGRNLKRLWQDAHNAIGVLSLPFHAMFALTGALFCLLAVSLPLLDRVAFDGKLSGAYAQALSTAPTLNASGIAVPMRPLPELMTRAAQVAADTGMHDFQPDYIHFQHYGDQQAIIEIRGTGLGSLGAYGTIALRGTDGSLLAANAGNRYDRNGIVYASLYGLHFGNYGGRVVQWLYFLLGLTGAFLFYSGNLLWIESRRKRRLAQQPRSVRIMARATVGICLGSCLGISATFAASLVVGCLVGTQDVAQALAQQLAGYGTVVLACAYAAWRSLPRATMELLVAIATLTILTALADLLRNADAWICDLSGTGWGPAEQAVMAVDLVGIALGLAFAAMARGYWRRARLGEPNSIWAVPS